MQFYAQLESIIFQCSLGFVLFYAKPFCFHYLFTSSKTAAWPFTSPLCWCKSGLKCGPLHNPSQGPFSIFVPGYASQWGIFCGDSLTSVGLLMYSHWARHGWLLRLIPGTFVFFLRWCTAIRETGIMRTSAFDWRHWTRLNLDTRFVGWWQSVCCTSYWDSKAGDSSKSVLDCSAFLKYDKLFYVPAIVLRCNTAVFHEMPGIPLGSDAMGGWYDVMAFSGVWLYFPASGFDICSSGCCCSVDALMQMHVWSSKGWSKVKLGYFYYVHDYRWISMLFLNDEFTLCYFDRFNVIIASCLNTEFCGTIDTCQPSF